jgi:hypothetical protein
MDAWTQGRPTRFTLQGPRYEVRATRFDGRGSACARPRRRANWRPSPGRDRRRTPRPARRWRTHTNRSPPLRASRVAHPGNARRGVLPAHAVRGAVPPPPPRGSWCLPPFRLSRAHKPNKNRPSPERRSVIRRWLLALNRLAERLPGVVGEGSHAVELAFPFLLPLQTLRRDVQHAPRDEGPQTREPELAAPAAPG